MPHPLSALSPTLHVLIAACLLASAAPSLADEKLARSNACIACHQVERRVVGPAFKDIAKRRADEADAVGLLADHIRNGSKGVYGAIPMPPNPRVSEEDAKRLAEWIMGLQAPAQ